MSNNPFPRIEPGTCFSCVADHKQYRAVSYNYQRGGDTVVDAILADGGDNQIPQTVIL
jgi:hypothetical protein